MVHAAIHVGSHVDAPMHKLSDGVSIDRYPLERFIGEAVPVSLYHKRADEAINRKICFRMTNGSRKA